MTSPLLAPSFSEGYALVTPRGLILGLSYRETRDRAIADFVGGPHLVDLLWPGFVADGYTVQFVYARIFVPQYFPSKPEPEGAEA